MQKYRVNKGFIVQKLDNKTVIFDGEESALYTFNETASYIFQKLKLGWEENKIIEAIIKKYGVKRERLDEDVRELISDLKKKKIISAEKSRK